MNIKAMLKRNADELRAIKCWTAEPFWRPILSRSLTCFGITFGLVFGAMMAVSLAFVCNHGVRAIEAAIKGVFQ